jgi:GH15 family glucan-1,4-alpha-glucosidase
LPAHDPRIVHTVEAIQLELPENGLVKRYRRGVGDGSEGKFLACSFWLIDSLVAMNRTKEARQLFERLLGLGNDAGLLSEEYDDSNHRMLGNFPQALSHIALISSALNFSDFQRAADGHVRRLADTATRF